MKNTYHYTHEMPVSAQFYKRLIDRVHTIITTLGHPHAAPTEHETIGLIHHYLSTGNADAPSGEISRIILLTLRAEIDAAILRSRRARAAAARRRTTLSASSANTIFASTVTPTVDPAPTCTAIPCTIPSSTPSYLSEKKHILLPLRKIRQTRSCPPPQTFRPEIPPRRPQKQVP